MTRSDGYVLDVSHQTRLSLCCAAPNVASPDYENVTVRQRSASVINSRWKVIGLRRRRQLRRFCGVSDGNKRSQPARQPRGSRFGTTISHNRKITEGELVDKQQGNNCPRDLFDQTTLKLERYQPIDYHPPRHDLIGWSYEQDISLVRTVFHHRVKTLRWPDLCCRCYKLCLQLVLVQAKTTWLSWGLSP